MRIRRKKYQDLSPISFLLLRERLGIRRYRKTTTRDEDKKRIILKLALKQIEEKERKDFILIGHRKRRLMPSLGSKGQ